MTRPILRDVTVTIPRDATLRLDRVDIALISLPDNYCAMDYNQANVYADIIRAGTHDLAPILLLQDGERFWLIDGRHRLVGTMLAGKRDVLSLITNRLDLKPTDRS